MRFEQLLDEDALLEDVLPSVYQRYQAHYQGYTLRRLCQEMHQLSVNDNIKQLQKEMFRKAHFGSKNEPTTSTFGIYTW